MANIFDIVDPRGKKIICTEKTWDEHIKKHFGNSDFWKGEAEETVKNPDSIYSDVDCDKTENYYRQLEKVKIKVCTRLIDDEIIVVSAHLRNVIKTGEILLWKK